MTTQMNTERPEKHIKHFPAIRYAEAPVGDLRYAPPKAVKFDPSTLSTLSTQGKGTIFPQTPSRLASVMGDFASRVQSEDSLNVAVWTPATDQASRPVLFWIHGGGFSSGGGALDWYDGTTLSQEGDIVVVCPNYRLGALGFLCYPGLSNGNMAILDIEMALQWTRDNIHLFGGDPNRITVAGQSAGAWSSALMVSRTPEHSPNIHQIILQSGVYNLPADTLENAHTAAEIFLEILTKRKVDATSLELAKQASVADILAAQSEATIQVIKNNTSRLGFAPVFGPVTDGIEIPEMDFVALMARGATRVPVMVGWTHDEMAAFSPPATPGSEAATAIRRNTMNSFGYPSMLWATNARKAGKAAYVYSFDWCPEGSKLMACHTIELPFVFGTFPSYTTAPMLANAPVKPLEGLSKQVRAAWLSFIKYGNPQATANTPARKKYYSSWTDLAKHDSTKKGHQHLPDWQMFDAETASVMHINLESHVELPSK